MRRSHTTSRPINIAPSSPQHYPICPSHSDSDTDDDIDDGQHGMNGHISNSHSHNHNNHNHDHYQQHQHQHYDNSNQHQHQHQHHSLNTSFHNMTVGSLPSSRREKRFMVSSGTSEFYSNRQRSQGGGGGGLLGGMNGNGNSNGIGNGNDIGIGNGGMNQRHRPTGIYNHHESMARSMPVPSAPFLASRKDRASGERLSRIPNIKLPENASESFSTASTSVPYGSLNDSQFRLPNRTKVRFSDENKNENSDNNNSNDINNNINSNSEQRISQSYQSSYSNIEQKVEEMRRNGTLIKNETKSGLAALLGDDSTSRVKKNNMNRNGDRDDDRDGDGIYVNKEESNDRQTSNNGGWGIGALINDNRGKTGIGNVSSHQQQQQNSSLSAYDQSSIPSSINFGSSCTNTSVLTIPNQSQPMSFSHRDSNPLIQTTTEAITGATAVRSNPTQPHFNNTNLHNDTNSANDTQLSGSLTGLDILKKSPRGMTKLNSEETKAILEIQARSRSYSGDINSFLPDPYSPSPTRITPLGTLGAIVDGISSSSQEMMHNDIHYQRRFSNNSDSSLNNGVMLGYDPDIDGAFDLDMDG